MTQSVLFFLYFSALAVTAIYNVINEQHVTLLSFYDCIWCYKMSTRQASSSYHIVYLLYTVIPSPAFPPLSGSLS